MPRTALDPRDLGVGIFYITAIEADHGFDDLHVSTSDGSVFRVQITRISSPTE